MSIYGPLPILSVIYSLNLHFHSCVDKKIACFILSACNMCRYFEGQLTPISEFDSGDAEETPQVKVTEAAEKVHISLYSFFFFFSFLIYSCFVIWELDFRSLFSTYLSLSLC